MNILVVGSGGREHALVWSLARSAHAPRLYAAPGNAGTARVAENIALAATDLDGLEAFVRETPIDLVVVGPEQPLVMGLTDRLRANTDALVVGPSAAAAQLEGSKAFAKAFMARQGIPTAQYRTFGRGNYAEAQAYVRNHGAPLVLKASGLAGGKGALVCLTMDEAESALDELMQDDRFGAAADEIVVESFMVGEEASVFALCDGTDYVLLAPAQDHKRIGDGDTGPNTGGMGAYAPAPVMTTALLEQAEAQVIRPTLAGMKAEGHPYQGILYVGLMITDEGPKVVEYNCRLGDPEAQVVLPLLKTDLVDVFVAMAEERLADLHIENDAGASACVVVASAGYPGAYEKGLPITGVDSIREEDVVVFEAGTRTDAGVLRTDGGRVLAVQALGPDLQSALDKAYQGVSRISFEGMYYRRDIGKRGLEYAQT